MADQSIQVTSRQVFTPKKDKEQGAQVSLFNTVSIPDQRSANGFSTFPALKSDISVRDNGYCDVKIHLDQEYDLSRPTTEKTDAGKVRYEHERVSGQSLVDILQQNLSKKKEQEQVKSVFINNVPDQFISQMPEQEDQTRLSRVFFKGVDDRPDFSIVLPAKQTEIQSTKKDGLPIPGRHNINLGTEDTVYKCSTRGENGKFEYFQMTAGELKSHYDKQQKAYMADRRAQDKVQGAKEEEAPVAQVNEDYLAID